MYDPKYKRAQYIKRRKILKRQILSGCYPPLDWYQCVECGEWAPYFTSYIQARKQAACPSFFTGTKCAKNHRARKQKETRAIRAEEKARGIIKKADTSLPDAAKQEATIRETLCAATPFCTKISECLDKEIKMPGTMPLCKEGSCKVPNTGATVRLKAACAINVY